MSYVLQSQGLLHIERGDLGFLCGFALGQGTAAAPADLSPLHPEERTAYGRFSGPRRESYLLGRCCGKAALLALFPDRDPAACRIENDPLGKPLLRTEETPSLGISLSHTGDRGAALVFPADCPMGIDLETLRPRQAATLSRLLTSEERLLCGDSLPKLTALWTAKESLGKLLGVGIGRRYEIYRAEDLREAEGLWQVRVRNFPQFRAEVRFSGDLVLAIAFFRDFSCRWGTGRAWPFLPDENAPAVFS